MSIDAAPAAVRALVAQLASSGTGRTEHEPAEHRYVITALEERGLIAAAVPGLVEVEPLRGAVPASRATVPPEPALSRFAFLRPEGRDLAMESPLAAGRAILRGRRGSALAGALAAGETDVLDAEERAAVALLAAAGLLAGEAEESEPARAWEWHDLLFHAETRGGPTAVREEGRTRSAARSTRRPTPGRPTTARSSSSSAPTSTSLLARTRRSLRSWSDGAPNGASTTTGP